MTQVPNSGRQQSDGAVLTPAWDQTLKSLRAASGAGDFRLAMQALEALDHQIFKVKDAQTLRHLKAEVSRLAAALEQDQRKRGAQLLSAKQQRGAVASYRRCETFRQ